MHLDKFILIFFPLIILLNYLIIKNFRYFFLNKIVDREFNKPQAFHLKPVPRIGGFLICLYFILFSFFFFEKNFFLFKIFSITFLFFLIGFLSDINLRIKPYKRLLLMLIISPFLIYFFEIKVVTTQFFFLDNLINSNKFITILFVCLCLVFISNGCNFVDGFNGLLLIHIIIILSVLYFINHTNSNNDLLKYLIILLIFILISVLFYNFPKAKVFLGDSGAYFLGTITSLIIIEMSNFNHAISPFFFASLLFYVFFEVFFSFFRKIFLNLSPIKPDSQHLHMLFFKFIFSKVKNINKANYLTGLFINIFYLLAILPLLFNYKNMTFCKIYFFILINIYLLSYYVLREKSLKFKAKR